MYSAMAEDPTKPIARTRGSVSSVSTASLSPLTTLSTPAGSPASTSSSAGRIGTQGPRAGGERGRELPHRDHGWEIERRDPRDDAERLAQRVEIDAGAGAVAELALQKVGNAAGELDHFEPALDV